jgi:hypothetical protein
MPNTKTYQCENCGGTFEEVATREQEAVEERHALFASSDDNVQVCHSCWVKLMERGEKMGIIGPEWRRYR